MVNRRPRNQQPLAANLLDIYLARHTPAKWIGTEEAADADAAIKERAKQFDIQDTKKLTAVRRR